MTEPGVHVRATPGLLLRLDEMNTQPDAQNNVCSSTVPDSEDSEEESSQEEPSITSWSELSIIERVGLNSAQMSEKDLETAFSQIALAFRCDQYTLKQRLQAEEHARNLAEENVQLELSRGRETLEALKGLCLDSRRSKVLQRLELSLDILGGTVERISNTAEVLGAVHQEARVSRAVELMVAHVENLRRRDDRNMAELEEAKKAIQQQNPFRTLIDPSASPEPEDSDSRKRSSHHHSIRRRVSISVIPSKTQETLKDLSNWDTPEGSSSRRPACSCPSPSLSCDCMSSAATQGDGHSVDDRPLDPDGTLADALNPERLPSKQPTRNIQNKSSSRDTLRHRHKGKSAVSRKKAEKDQKAKTACRRLPAGLCGSLWRHPLARWLLRCRWVLLCTYLLVLFCVTTLTLFLLDAS